MSKEASARTKPSETSERAGAGLTNPVVEPFEDRQPEAPTRAGRGRVVVYPGIGIDQEAAVCALCGYWGIVEARSKVLDALAAGGDRDLVCQTCADEVGLEGSE